MSIETEERPSAVHDLENHNKHPRSFGLLVTFDELFSVVRRCFFVF